MGIRMKTWTIDAMLDDFNELIWYQVEAEDEKLTGLTNIIFSVIHDEEGDDWVLEATDEHNPQWLIEGAGWVFV